MTTRVTYFVHGTSLDNEAHISSGWKDVALSAKGEMQARSLGEVTSEKQFDTVFCSDLQRAQRTAALAWGDRFQIIADARLRECNYGDLNGDSSDIVEPMQESSCIETPFPNGESYEDVKKRVADFLSYVRVHYAGKHIAIVGHKAPQLALDVLLHGKTWEEALRDDWRKKKAWQPGWEYILE